MLNPKGHIRFPQLAYDLLYTALFPRHLLPLLQPLISNWTSCWGEDHNRDRILNGTISGISAYYLVEPTLKLGEDLVAGD